jgi:hypothetical protein
MKLHTSFITNSSSSSFIVIGTDKYNDQFMEKGNIKSELYSEFELVFTYDGDEDGYISINDVPKLLSEMTIPQVKQYFVQKAKEHGIDIDVKDVEFTYGGYYNG